MRKVSISRKMLIIEFAVIFAMRIKKKLQFYRLNCIRLEMKLIEIHSNLPIVIHWHSWRFKMLFPVIWAAQIFFGGHVTMMYLNGFVMSTLVMLVAFNAIKLSLNIQHESNGRSLLDIVKKEVQIEAHSKMVKRATNEGKRSRKSNYLSRMQEYCSVNTGKIGRQIRLKSYKISRFPCLFPAKIHSTLNHIT